MADQPGAQRRKGKKRTCRRGATGIHSTHERYPGEEWAIKVKEHPETYWCYGNHDVSYLWYAMQTGFAFLARDTVVEGVEKLNPKAAR